MKHRVDFGKYLIRFMGSLCILIALVLMVYTPIIQVEGVRSKDLRSVYKKVEEVSNLEEKWLLNVAGDLDAAEKYDLEDNNLPNTKIEIKAWFEKLNTITKKVFDREITLREVVVLIWNIPGIAKDAGNLMNTEYILDGAINLMVKHDPRTFGAETLRRNMENAEDCFGVIRIFGYVAIGMVVLLGLLALDAMIGNLRNKVRWGKYVLLLIVMVFAVTGYVGMPMLSEQLRMVFAGVDMLQNLELRMTGFPILAIILLIVPIALDVWNKKREKRVKVTETKEEEQAVQAHNVESTVSKGKIPTPPNHVTEEKEALASVAMKAKPVISRMSNAELKRKVREELTDYVDKWRGEIKEQQSIASNERFLSTTVRGGFIAAAAESACLERAQKADNRAAEMKRKIAWHEEMLEKYR